jgi:uncharacterized protein (TIGR02270 family)
MVSTQAIPTNIRILESIVSQHAQEASFLWLLRDDAIRAPDYDLSDLEELEDRIDAHLDGLRVASEAAWPFCEEGLKVAETGEVFTAAYTALDQSRPDWLEQTLEVAAKTPECSRGLISALGWLPKVKLQGYVVGWLKSEEPAYRQIGLSACAIQRVDCGAYLRKGLDDQDTCVCARALRSVGEIRRSDLLPMVLEHLNDDDRACQFWAAWSATLLGDSRGLEILQLFFNEESPFRARALELGLLAMDKTSSVHWVREHTHHPGFERAVITATGLIGDPVAVPWLLSLMKNPEYSRLAGESFSLITGVNLANEDLEGDQPEDFEAKPSENPADEDVAMDPDEALPWPHEQRVVHWWKAHQASFPAGARFLVGQPLSQQHSIHLLNMGYQRQRRIAAIALSLRNPNEVLFNTSAPAKDQSRQLRQ